MIKINILMEEKTSFEFRLSILKSELEQIERIIGRIDEITQATKNWAIVIWSGGIAVIIASPNIELRPYIIITTIIPILFWIVDANFRKRQREFLFRNKQISDFLNSEELDKSFSEKKLTGIFVLDPKGKNNSGKSELEKFASLWKAMWFRSLRLFYLGLISISLILGVIFLINPSKDENNGKSAVNKMQKLEYELRIKSELIETLRMRNATLEAEVDQIKVRLDEINKNEKK